jgi:folylpolyglutamate synthase/dihydropteroate synthase
LFALLSFHAFIRGGVDAAIFETHHGREYDSTNVIEKPIATAITTLGIDYIKQLGSSIDSIAWNKAGISNLALHNFRRHKRPQLWRYCRNGLPIRVSVSSSSTWILLSLPI